MRSFKFTRLMTIAAMAMFALTQAAAAATINVPGDAATIQTGINLATSGDEVVVAPGTYNEHVNMLGKAITLRSVNPMDPAIVAATILDGGGTGIVITCATGEGAGTVVTGLTITGGFTFASGGGMLNDGASPTVSACVFVDNQGNASGGAIANLGAAPHITGCTFNGNTSFGNGGAIVNASSNAVVDACLFVTNTVDSSGGAIANLGGTPHITRCTFDGNAADVAGGIGGAILNSSSNVVVDSCLFVGNQSTFNGGAIVSSNGSPIVVNSVFSGNTAGFEGGAMRITGNAFPAVVNCTFSGNSAASAGDAIRAQMTGGALTITNCVLWDGGADEVVAGGVGATTVTYSDIQGGIAGAGNIDADPLFIDADGADDMVGTSDDDLRLAAYSPCTDAGDNTASALSGVLEDLEGLPRFVDDGNVADTGVGTPPLVDMGAYERQEDSHRVLVLNPSDSIQAAIDDPLTNDGDTIILNPGTYNEAINLRGKAITIQSTHPDDAGYPNGSDTILYGADLEDGTTLITCDSGETEATVIKGLGIATHHTVETRGMLNNGASPTIANCWFSGLESAKGAAMRNVSGSNPLVTGCQFTFNEAEDGGAIHNANGSSPTIVGCVFELNYVSFLGDGGGAIANFDGSSPVVTNCTFRENDANSLGGGMLSDTECYPIVTNCAFVNNTAHSGGGIASLSDSLTTIINCTFDSNSALRGGGVALFTGSITTMSNCIFTGNKAYDVPGPEPTTNRGGAVYCVEDTVTVTNCTFTDNTAENDGGAVYVIGNGGNAALTNCVLWGDSPNEIAGDGAISVSHSIVEGGYAGVGVVDDDPRFLADDDLRLGGCSPAVDAGDNNAPGLAGITTDSDGAPRYVDDAGKPNGGIGDAPIVDMGAYERQENTGLFFTVTPADSVQNVIDLACPGSEIVLAEGTYNQALTLRADITIRSTDPDDPAVVAATVLDGTGLGTSIIICDSVGNSTVISGLTIANATTTGDGGGIRNTAASPIVTKCVFRDNLAGFGGAMLNESGSAPRVIDCILVGNDADLLGGAIANFASSPTLINCLLIGNAAGVVGGGMYNDNGSSPTLINCTFSGNDAVVAGGGLLNIDNSNPTVTNCIFWDDSPEEIADFDSASVVSYSVIDGGFAGDGNIDADPLFVDANGADDIIGTSDDDLRLDAGSPCIDAANYEGYTAGGGGATDLDGAARTFDACVADTGVGAATWLDIGAFEWQAADIADADSDGVPDCIDACPGFDDNADADEDDIPDGCDVCPGFNDNNDMDNDGIPDACDADCTTFPVNVATAQELSDAFDCANYFPDISTIYLDADITVSSDLEVITPIVIEGQGHVLERTGGPGVSPMFYVSSAGDLTLLETTLSNVASSHGGAIRVDGGTLAMTDCQVTNSAGHFGGGAIYAHDNADVTLERVVMTGNVTDSGNGGALEMVGGTLAIRDSLFAGNTARSGSAISVQGVSQPLITNTIVSGNFTDGNPGGAIRNRNCTLTLLNCTLAGNRSVNFGGGLYSTNNATSTLINCIVGGNTSDSGSDREIYTEFDSAFNISFSALKGGIPSVAGPFNNLGGNLAFTNAAPLFVNPINPASAPTTAGDYHLAADSVAIDQGSNTDAANAGLTTDFEGDNRIIGLTVDMGADEAACSLDGDEDGDGVCNAMDVCPTGDDNVDADNNGIPDACDTACPGGAIGDVNTDGFVNAGDVAAFTAVLLDPDSATANERCAADVNLDGQVDGEDIQGIVSLILTP